MRLISYKEETQFYRLNWVDQIEKRKRMSFGSLSSGITNRIKQVEWQKITEAVNAVSSASVMDNQTC